MKTLIASLLLLLVATLAHAQVWDASEGTIIPRWPTLTMEGVGPINNPGEADYNARGYYELIPATPPEGERITDFTVAIVDGKAVQTATATELIPPEPEPLLAIYANAAAQVEAQAPLLEDHPSAEDVPAPGETIQELWYVRQNDGISSQLSAHDAEGNPINRTRNLRTGRDIKIELGKMLTANTWAQARQALRQSARPVRPGLRERINNRSGIE